MLPYYLLTIKTTKSHKIYSGKIYCCYTERYFCSIQLPYKTNDILLHADRSNNPHQFLVNIANLTVMYK